MDFRLSYLHRYTSSSTVKHKPELSTKHASSASDHLKEHGVK